MGYENAAGGPGSGPELDFEVARELAELPTAAPSESESDSPDTATFIIRQGAEALQSAKQVSLRLNSSLR